MGVIHIKQCTLLSPKIIIPVSYLLAILDSGYLCLEKTVSLRFNPKYLNPQVVGIVSGRHLWFIPPDVVIYHHDYN